ncbi:MAG: hypothetical protein SVT52_03430 [Planctomycetota bacterium]|nr:hypothetical protein [Planctomycetota bacterium]
MADEQNELRQVNWNEVFSFSHIFKSFRMAVHPSKLMLSLAAIIVVFLSGWVLDVVWSTWGGYAKYQEIPEYVQNSSEAFDLTIENWKDRRLDNAAMFLANAENQRRNLSAYRQEMRGPSSHLSNALARQLAELNTKEDSGTAYSAPSWQEILERSKEDGWSDMLEEAEDKFDEEISRIEVLLESSYDQAEGEINKIGDKEEREKAEDALEANYDKAMVAISIRVRDFNKAVSQIRGLKIFSSLMAYENKCIGKAVSAVYHRNILGGLDSYKTMMNAKRIQPIAVSDNALPADRAWRGSTPMDDPPGFVYWVLMAVHGLGWLICQHWVYAILFLLICLASCALFGGAVNRIAALHFAREEKISAVQALKFSAGKFLSFLTAPLIPIAIILFMAGLMTLGGLIGSVWFIGNIIMGVLFFLAIIAGLLVAFLLVGLIGGAGLMYPTIAVEGSDSFDAISRSYSYVFAKPWRTGLYGLIALFYGVVCYMFVRLFVYIALICTHSLVKWGVAGGGARLSADADKLDVMWTAPTFDSLFGNWSTAAMTGTQGIGAFLIGIWVFLVAATVMAFGLSYAASSTTVIYYLLRRKVDATDLDDVYIEEAEEEPIAEGETSEAAEETAEETPKEGEDGEQEKED